MFLILLANEYWDAMNTKEKALIISCTAVGGIVGILVCIIIAYHIKKINQIRKKATKTIEEKTIKEIPEFEPKAAPENLLQV